MRHCEVTDRMLRDKGTWSGDFIHMKKRPTEGDKVPIGALYSKFGVLLSTELPLRVFVKDMDFDVDGTRMTYDTVEACMADGWVVD